VTRSFISSCSSASVHSLPCGPRIAEEKESGCPAPSRFTSAGAGEYTRGAVVGAEAEEMKDWRRGLRRRCDKGGGDDGGDV
jgi:hypothetical protein